jgi:hypothetical protein
MVHAGNLYPYIRHPGKIWQRPTASRGRNYLPDHFLGDNPLMSIYTLPLWTYPYGVQPSLDPVIDYVAEQITFSWPPRPSGTSTYWWRLIVGLSGDVNVINAKIDLVSAPAVGPPVIPYSTGFMLGMYQNTVQGGTYNFISAITGLSVAATGALPYPQPW